MTIQELDSIEVSPNEKILPIRVKLSDTEYLYKFALSLKVDLPYRFGGGLSRTVTLNSLTTTAAYEKVWPYGKVFPWASKICDCSNGQYFFFATCAAHPVGEYLYIYADCGGLPIGSIVTAYITYFEVGGGGVNGDVAHNYPDTAAVSANADPSVESVVLVWNDENKVVDMYHWDPDSTATPGDGILISDATPDLGRWIRSNP
jgi:hypothetical protein